MLGWRDGETVSDAERIERAKVLRDLCAPLIEEAGTRRREGTKDTYSLRPIGTALELVLTVTRLRRETALAVYADGKQMFAMKWDDDSRVKVPRFVPGGWELGAIEIGRKFAERSRQRPRSANLPTFGQS